MADALTVYAGNALLEHITGRTAYTKPTNTYAALFLVAPTESGGGTEVSAADYVRQQITWGVAADKEIANSADVRFPAVSNAATSWGSIVTVAFFDQLTAGNLLMFGNLSAPVTINTGDAFKLVSGGLLATFRTP